MSAIADVLKAFAQAKQHVKDMPDDMPLSLIVRFRLGDLRRLEQWRDERVAEAIRQKHQQRGKLTNEEVANERQA